MKTGLYPDSEHGRLKKKNIPGFQLIFIRTRHSSNVIVELDVFGRTHPLFFNDRPMYLPLCAERCEQAIGIAEERTVAQLLRGVPAAGGVERRRGQVVHGPA